MDEAFLAWWRPLRGQYGPEIEALVYEAFKAGFAASRVKIQTETSLPLTGTAESRTIVAALRLFLENVLPMASEEIAAGEYLSVEETERLIRRIEERVQ